MGGGEAALPHGGFEMLYIDDETGEFFFKRFGDAWAVCIQGESLNRLRVVRGLRRVKIKEDWMPKLGDMFTASNRNGQHVTRRLIRVHGRYHALDVAAGESKTRAGSETIEGLLDYYYSDISPVV